MLSIDPSTVHIIYSNPENNSVTKEVHSNFIDIGSRTHHFADKGLYSQSCFFPVVMYRCESWTIKNAECPRFDVFELSCWRRLLRVPGTAG